MLTLAEKKILLELIKNEISEDRIIRSELQLKAMSKKRKSEEFKGDRLKLSDNEFRERLKSDIKHDKAKNAKLKKLYEKVKEI